MALPDYAKRELGTAIIWGQTAAAGVTNVLSFNGLAAGSGRMGVEEDISNAGANAWEDEFYVELRVETGTAPTAGGTVELYLACGQDGTNYPGGVSGADAAWPGDGNEDEWRKQLGVPVVVLVATNDGNVVAIQDPKIWRPSGPWIVAVVDNNMDQAIRTEGTAADNDSRVILRPRQQLIQDAA